MDRMTEAALLSDPHAMDCRHDAAQTHKISSGASPLPSPQERRARIVRTIEDDIIPRLLRAHRPEAANAARLEMPEPQHPSETEVLAFVALMLAAEETGWPGMLHGLMARGVQVDDIYLGLMAPAAAELGRMWEEDICSFTDVTVALGRMQRILRTLAAGHGCELDQAADGRRVLLLPAPGEQHTFGLSMVAEFFRRSGWDVVGDTEGRTSDPAKLVRGEWFDVIGISVGLDTRLDWLKSGIAAVRNASRNRAIAVMVGGPLFVKQPGLVLAVGADATAVDGKQAPVVAEDMLRQRLHRL